MPPGTGDDNPIVQPTTTVPKAPKAPEPLVAQPPAAVIKREKPDTDFERQSDYLRGEIMARQGQWDTYRGQVEAHDKQLRDQIDTLQGRITSLTGDKTTLQEQVNILPDLQSKAQQVEALAGEVGKLRFVMAYPALTNAVVEETVKKEDGTEAVVRKNPYLDLLLSSTLGGEQFEAMVADLAQAVRSKVPQGTPPAPPTTTGATPAGGPAPTTPTTHEELKRQREEAWAAGDTNLQSALNLQMLELRLQSE